MTGLAQCVLALAAIVSCGCAAVRALGVEWRAGASLWVPGAGVLFGLGAYSLGFAAVLLSVGPDPIALAAKDAALAGLGILAWRRVRSLARVPSTPAAAASPWTRVAWTILAGAIVVTVGAWILQARVAPDGDWDAWMIWNLRARFLARAPDLARVFAPSLAFTHLDYPLMVPGIVTSFWRIAATEPPGFPRRSPGCLHSALRARWRA